MTSDVEAYLDREFGRGIASYEVGDYFEVSDSTEFCGIAALVRQRKPEKLISLLEALIGETELELPHPLLDGVKTQARCSLQLNMINFVFFSAHDDSSRWVLLQLTNFIDAIVVPGRLLYVSNMQKPAIKGCFTQLLKGHRGIDKLTARSDRFAGFLVSQRTPYHFFYDILKNLTQLAPALAGSGKSVRYRPDQLYYPIEAISQEIDHGEVRPGELLIYPTTVGQNALNALGQRYNESTRQLRVEASTSNDGRFVGKQMRAMERRILRYSQARPSKVETRGFVLWISVCDAKRSWIEQEEGFAELILAFSRIYRDLTVLFDGMTAPVSGVGAIDTSKDIAVFNAIRKRLPQSVHCVPMTGMGYTEKVSLGCRADLFISDAGSAALVPLRFCRKPGVLFSNGSIHSFPDFYGARIRSIDKSLILVPASELEKGIQFRSFHMYWKDVHAAAMALLRETGLSADAIDVSAEERSKFFRLAVAADAASSDKPEH